VVRKRKPRIKPRAPQARRFGFGVGIKADSQQQFPHKVAMCDP